MFMNHRRWRKHWQVPPKVFEVKMSAFQVWNHRVPVFHEAYAVFEIMNGTLQKGLVLQNLVPWLRKPQRVDCRLSLIVFESVWLWFEAKQWPRKVHKTSNCSLDTKKFKNFLQQFFKLWQGCSSLTRGTECIKRICRNFSKTSREHRMYLFSINVSLSFCAQSNKQHKLIAVKYTCSILNCSILPFTCKQI